MKGHWGAVTPFIILIIAAIHQTSDSQTDTCDERRRGHSQADKRQVSSVVAFPGRIFTFLQNCTPSDILYATLAAEQRKKEAAGGKK